MPSAEYQAAWKARNPQMAQQLLRHESPATTAGYLHPTREDHEAALQGLDDLAGSEL